MGSPRGVYVLPHVEDKCLVCVPASEMNRRIDKMRQHAIADGKARQFARALGSRTDLVSWDTQGRIRLKDELLSFAAIVDQVVLIGAFDTFELWAPDSLNKAGGTDEQSLRDAARYVGF